MQKWQFLAVIALIISARVYALPNLIVTEVDQPAETLCIDPNLQYVSRVTVANNGDTGSGATITRINMWGRAYLTDTPALASGATAEITVTSNTFNPEGCLNYTIKTIADYTGVIAESNESDNILFASYSLPLCSCVSSPTPSPTISALTLTFTETPTETGTFTTIPIATNTPTSSPTPLPLETSTCTGTPSVTETATPHEDTHTPTNTMSATETKTPTLTRTATDTRTPILTRTPTYTRIPTLSRTPTCTRTPILTRTPTYTRTPTLSRTPTCTRTPTLSRTPTCTRTPTLSRTPTLTRTHTPTRSFTSTKTVTPTRTGTVVSVATPTLTVSPTAMPTPTVTETIIPAPPSCPDFDDNGYVDAPDLLILENEFGSYDPLNEWDMNGDTLVGTLDLLEFSRFWHGQNNTCQSWREYADARLRVGRGYGFPGEREVETPILLSNPRNIVLYEMFLGLAVDPQLRLEGLILSATEGVVYFDAFVTGKENYPDGYNLIGIRYVNPYGFYHRKGEILRLLCEIPVAAKSFYEITPVSALINPNPLNGQSEVTVDLVRGAVILK